MFLESESGSESSCEPGVIERHHRHGKSTESQVFEVHSRIIHMGQFGGFGVCIAGKPAQHSSNQRICSFGS